MFPTLTTAFALTLLQLSTPLVSALSIAEIGSVFGPGATDLTGSSVVLPQFTFSIVTNTTHALVSYNATNSQSFQVGWMATGVGSAMVNADFLIAWPNPATATGPASVPWTITHRQSPNGEQQPLVSGPVNSATSTTRFYTYLPALSSTDLTLPYTVVSYLRLLTMPANYPSSSTFKNIARERTSFIYASSTKQPQNVAEDATITQHDQAHAVTSLDLSIPISLGAVAVTSSAVAAKGTASASVAASAVSSGVAPSSTASAAPSAGLGTEAVDNSRTSRDMILIAHATTASLGLLLFSPIGILVARFMRGYSWFPIHAGIQLTATALIITAFGLAVYATGTPHFFDSHTRLGLVIFLLVIVQVILGSLAHLFIAPRVPSTTARFPTLSNKSPIRLAHIALGLTITVLGFIQIRSGMTEWAEKSDALTDVPKGVIVVFWILVAAEVILYAFGWVREGMGKNAPRALDGNGSLEKVDSEGNGQKHAVVE